MNSIDFYRENEYHMEFYLAQTAPHRVSNLVYPTFACLQTACGLLTGKYKYSDLQEPSEDIKDGRFFHNVTWASV